MMDLQTILNSFNPITYLKEALDFQQGEAGGQVSDSSSQEKKKPTIPELRNSSTIPPMDSSPSTNWQVPHTSQLLRDNDVITLLLDERNSGTYPISETPIKANHSSLQKGTVMKEGGIDQELARRMIVLESIKKLIKEGTE